VRIHEIHQKTALSRLINYLEDELRRLEANGTRHRHGKVTNFYQRLKVLSARETNKSQEKRHEADS
jgi:hypothetical protein